MRCLASLARMGHTIIEVPAMAAGVCTKIIDGGSNRPAHALTGSVCTSRLERPQERQ